MAVLGVRLLDMELFKQLWCPDTNTAYLSAVSGKLEPPTYWERNPWIVMNSDERPVSSRTT